MKLTFPAYIGQKAGFASPWRLVTLAHQQESATPVTLTCQLIKWSTAEHGDARLSPADINRKSTSSALGVTNTSVRAGEAGEAYTLADKTVDGAAWQHPSLLAVIGRKSNSPFRGRWQHVGMSRLRRQHLHAG